MLTVGEILKKERLSKKITFEDIEKNLRIRKKFLIALEENSWEKLPSLTYIKGFLKNYSSFLGLDSEELLAIFRREYQEQERSGVLPSGLSHPLNEPIFRLTPQLTVIGVILLFIIVFFGYLFFQYKIYISPPNLIITKPAEGETLLSEKVDVSGKTDSDAVISVNGVKIAISAEGEFSTILTLPPGVNTIAVESTSKYGKKKTASRTIQVQINQ